MAASDNLGPQFPRTDTGKHGGSYSAGKDIHLSLSANQTGYTGKHRASLDAPKPPTQSKPPTRTDPNTRGTTGKPGDARPRPSQHRVSQEHLMYHQHHTSSPSDEMLGLVGFQGNNGRTVA